MIPTRFIGKVDDLGRVALPREWLYTLHRDGKARLAIDVDGDRVVLKKYPPPCIVCANEENTEIFRGNTPCRDCLHSLLIEAV